jgi:hypothetical protein
MILRKFWNYLTFQKQEGPKNTNIRIMHGINRISILMFLGAVIVMVVRCLK